ncbi:MAG: hypothetical protein PHU80_07980, partial [Kiritimatiellae bacterium]|nr:hypothetical protein [Kiritimatiellia bacterium]
MNTAEWTFEYGVPALLLIGALLTALAAVGYALWRYLPRDLSGAAVVALRILFFAILFWVLLLPGRKSSLIEIVKPRFIVLLDISASMGQSADESAGRTRWEAAMEMLKQPWAKAVQSKCVVDVYPFHADLETPVGLEQVAELRPEGRSTQLNLGLTRLFDRLRGQELAGVMLLSDAIDTREKNDNWAEAGWPAPVYAVQLEKSVELDDTPDMRVDNVDTPRRAIVGWDTSMTVTIAGQGGKGEPFSVILLKDNKESDKVAMQLPSEGGSRDVQFKLTHPEVGTETYMVRIPP